MSLEELGLEYRESARACRQRAKEVKQLLDEGDLSDTEMMLQRRRFNMLIEMAADTSAMGTYLINYYGRKVTYGNHDVRERNGVSEPSLFDEILRARRRNGPAAFGGAAGGADRAAGADGEALLRGAAHDAGHRGDAGSESLDREPDAEGGAGEAAALSALYEQIFSA